MNIKSLTLLVVLFGLSVPVNAEQFLFLSATNDRELVSYKIDPVSGTLTKHHSMELPGAGGPMTATRDGQMLYVQCRIKEEGEKQERPHIVSIAIRHGKLESLHVAPVSFRTPSMYVDNTGRSLLATNYGGAISVWKIAKNRHCTGESTDDEITEQYAHFITTDPTNRFVYSPHTNANVIYQYSFDSEAGTLAPLDPPTASGPDTEHQYHAPRHYAHHPTLNMGFTANERGGGISSWKQDPKTGLLTLQETLSTLPPGWAGNSFAADIHITPNGRFVYVSNRDGRKRAEGEQHGDTLAAFKIDMTTGKLKPAGHYATDRFPRSFCIDAAGSFVFAACELSDSLKAFRVNQKTGVLLPLNTYKTGKTPIWVTCVGD
jgi:6-phosphogluconolactonase